MNLLCIFLALLFIQSPSIGNTIKLEIGATLDRTNVSKNKNDRIATSPSDFYPFIDATVDGVKYLIAYQSESLRIKYIHTTDKKFRTKDGLKIGDSLSLTEEQVSIYPAWEIRGPQTRDGWYPVLGVDMPSLSPLTPKTFKDGGKADLIIVGFSKAKN